MKISRKESIRRKRISDGLKKHYRNKKRYEAIRKKRMAYEKGRETKFKKRMIGCVVVFDGMEYAFFDRTHPVAQEIQRKLNMFPDKKYIVKILLWLAIHTDRRSAGNIISGNGVDSDLTERIFETHLQSDAFWREYYAAVREYLNEHAEKGSTQYEAAEIQLRQITVC